MGRRRHGFFPNAADLVHFPRKAFFNQATPVLVPCPPHWISPLWEQEYQSKTGQMPCLKHEARTTQPLAHPYHKSKSVPSQWPKQPSVAAQLPYMNHRAVPLPYLNHQGVTKAPLPHKHPTVNSILTIPKPDFRSRVTAIPLTSAKQHLVPSLLDSKYQYEGPLDFSYRMEAASEPSYFPKIFADCDHRPEDLTQLSQHPLSSKFCYHHAEFPFMDKRTMEVTGNKAFPKHQARATHKPVKSIHSLETLPRPRLQDQVLTTKHHPRHVSSSPCSDLWSKSISFKTSDLDRWVQARTYKGLQPEHRLRETASLLRCIDNRSKDPSVLLSNLKGKTRATTACPPCSQNWTIARALPSPGTNHQTSTTPTPSQDSKPLEAPSCLEDPCAKTASSPSTQTPLGPDYKTKDTPGLSLPSEHQLVPIVIPVCLDHCSKAPQDSQFKATTSLFLSYKKSNSSDSDVQVTPLRLAPGLDVQTALPSAVINSQDHQVEVLQDMNPEAPASKGLDHLAIAPVDLGPSTSPPKPDYRDTLPLSYELKALALPRNKYTTEPAASDPNDPQTILPTDHDNQEISQLDPGSDQRSTQVNSDCRATYSPSPAEHQTENTPDCHKQFTIQDNLDQGETKLPEPGHQIITLTDQNHEDKLSIDIELQDKTDQVYWGIPPLDKEQKDTSPPGPDPQITLPSSHDHNDITVPGLDVLVQEELEQQEIVAPETSHQGPAFTGQAEWETSPLSIIDPKNLMLSAPEHQTIPPASPNSRAMIPQSLDHQAEDTPNANVQGIVQTEPAVFIFQNEEECEVSPPGINQVVTIEDLSHKAVTLPGKVFQDIALPDPEDQILMPSHTDQWTDDALGRNTQISLQLEKDHWQIVQFRTDNRVTTVEVWDPEATPTLSLDLLDTALPNPDHRVTQPFSADFQATFPLTNDHQEHLVSDANDEVSKVQLERGPQGAIPPEEDYQDTTLSSQDRGETSSLSIELQEVTLFGFNSLDELQSIPDHQSEAVPDPNTQATSPLDLYHSLKIVGPGQVTASISPKPPFVLLSSPENQSEAKSDVTNPKGTASSLEEEETSPPVPIYRAQAPPGPKHPNEAAVGWDHHSECPDEVQPGFPHHTAPRKKGQTSWRLNYIKPYTIEGGDVPEKTVDDIISSIPRDEIKSDICRQTVLQKMKKVSAPHCGDQGIPLDYPVCLICVSWIPNGCPHVWGMKYPCEAQLLAIPMPMSNSEQEINVKFVLQVDRTTQCSIFTPPYPYYDLQGPFTHPLNSPVSSHSDLRLPVSSRGKWLGFILGKDSQSEGRTLPTSQRPYTGERAIKQDSSRKEATSKEHRTFLRSILDMFHRKQRRN